VCSQGPSVCLKNHVLSKPVVLTFKCVTPPDFTKSPRPISIHFKNMCGNFVDYFDSVASKIPVTLRSKELSEFYLFFVSKSLA